MNGQEWLELLAQVQDEWAGDPNVIGVGLGAKVREGRQVPGFVLTFTVRRKVADDGEIAALGSRPIPREIRGVGTDVKVIHAIPSFLLSRGERETRVVDRLVGGCSTSVIQPLMSWPWGCGTLGSLCHHVPTGEWMGLSNAHVWGTDKGREVVQPYIPVDEILGASLGVLSCGPLAAHLATAEAPSLLTVALAVAAASAWQAAILSDRKDPHRRGQEGTMPADAAERTELETVACTARPLQIPLPGHPYRADVAWDYERQTDRGRYPFRVQETVENEHVLRSQTLWTASPRVTPGATVPLFATLDSANVCGPHSFQVVAYLFPEADPGRCVRRVLRPAEIQRTHELLVLFNDRREGEEATFPFEHRGVRFSSTSPGSFRLFSQGDVQLMGLRFTGDLDIALPPAREMEASFALRTHLGESGLAVEMYGADGRLLFRGPLRQKGDSPYVEVSWGPEAGPEEVHRLVIAGGGGETLLLGLDLTLAEELSESLFTGEYTVSTGEAQGRWLGALSIQTLNTARPGTPPAEAAALIGGIEAGVLACPGKNCAIEPKLYPLFMVE